MTFKLYNCDLGIKLNGQRYDFDHVNSLEIEDNERNRLTRGANARNTTGLAYKDGLREPKRWTIPIMAMSVELKAAFDLAFNAQTRMEVFCIDRTDGSSKMLKEAILSNKPQQLTLDETPDSLAVSLEFEGFASEENHKS